MGWLWSERILNSMGSEVPGELVIVKKNPAHGLEALIGVGWSELAGGFSQPHQYRTRLGHALSCHLEHGDFAHRIGRGAPIRIACLAAAKIDPDRLPVEASAIQVERDFVRVSRGANAMEFVLCHSLGSTSLSCRKTAMPRSSQPSSRRRRRQESRA